MPVFILLWIFGFPRIPCLLNLLFAAAASLKPFSSTFYARQAVAYRRGKGLQPLLLNGRQVADILD
ncbi:hypothetical protein UA70_30305, partial [Raoultella planticola]